MRKLSKQNRIIVLVIAVLISLVVGYAVFNSTLNIIGSSSAEGDFSVVFDSVGTLKETGSTNATASISDTKKVLTINAPGLEYPGALVEVPVVIKNNGSLSATLKGITTKGLDDTDIVVTYSGIAKDEILSVGEQRTMNVKVLWNRTSTKTSVKLNFSIELNYEQDISSSGDVTVPEDQKNLFTWDSSTVVSGLSQKGIAAVKANGGKLVIPEGVTEIASANYNLETGEGVIDKGFSPIVIGNLDFNTATEDQIYNPEINFITSVSLPSTLKKIGVLAFAYTNLSGELNLPGRLEIIEDGAFGVCDNISGVLNIPKSVKTIGSLAFLASDETLNKITAINIYNTTSFNSTTDNHSFMFRISPNVTVEGEYNLNASGVAGDGTVYSYNKGKLEFVGPNVTSKTIFEEITNQIIVSNGINIDSIGNISDDAKAALQIYLNLTVYGWKYGGPIGLFGSNKIVTREDLKNMLTTIGENQTEPFLTLEQADKYLEIIDHLQMGLTIDLTGVTTIGERAFSSAITESITIPNSVTSIGEAAFHNLVADSFHFGTGIKTIPKSIFWPAWTSGFDMIIGRTTIKNITIPEGITGISDQAFRAVAGITVLTIPSMVTTIGQRVFKLNDDLTTIVNKTGKKFDWGLAFSGTSGSIFETGTIVSDASKQISIIK